MKREKFVIFLSGLNGYFMRLSSDDKITHITKDINKAKRFSSMDAMCDTLEKVLNDKPQIATVNEIITLEIVTASDVLTEAPKKTVKFFS